MSQVIRTSNSASVKYFQNTRNTPLQIRYLFKINIKLLIVSNYYSCMELMQLIPGQIHKAKDTQHQCRLQQIAIPIPFHHA